MNLASAYVETNNVLKTIEHLEYALENNHKTIEKQIKAKGLEYFIEHINVMKAIVEYENKEYDEALILLEKIY